MTLVNKIRAILGSIDDINTVMYDSGWSANVRIDRNPAPYALLYLLSDWTLDISKGVAKEGADIQVFFFDKSNLDAKGEEKDLIVTQMELIAREFIRRVLADNTIIVAEDTIKLRSSWGQFDKFCVGVSVTMKIEDKQGGCI
jgi:hypothetical protein